MEHAEIFMTLSAYQDRFTAKRGDRTVSLPIFPGLEASRVFGQHVEALKTSASILASGFPVIVADLSPKGWNERFQQKEALPLTRAAKILHAAAIKQNGDLDAWRIQKLRWKWPLDPAIASETRQWLRGLKAGEAARVVLSDPAIAYAALSAWHLSGLDGTLKSQVEDTVIRASILADYSNAFQRQPTAADILASGPDLDAAARAAKEGLAVHDAARAEVGQVVAVLNSTVDFVAVVGDVSRDAAFAMISEAA